MIMRLTIQQSSILLSLGSQINEKTKKYVSDQMEEVCKAIIGTRRYILKQQYQQLAVTSYNWLTHFSTK